MGPLAAVEIVLADFIEEGFVANIEQSGCFFAIPFGLPQCAGDGFALGFVLKAANEGFQVSRPFLGDF